MSNIVNIYSGNLVLFNSLQQTFLEQGLGVSLQTSTNNEAEGHYSIFVFSNITDNSVETKESEFKNYFNKAKASSKSLFIFPITTNTRFNEMTKSWQEQILGQNDFVAGILYLGESVDTAETDWTAKEIIKLTFSMKAYGAITTLTYPYRTNLTAGGSEAIISVQKTDEAVPEEKNEPQTYTKKSNTFLSSIIRKFGLGLVVFVCLYLLSPLVSYFIALNLFRFSNSEFALTYPKLNQKAIMVSRFMANVSVAVTNQFQWTSLSEKSTNLNKAVDLNSQLNRVNMDILSLLQHLINNSDRITPDIQKLISSLDYLKTNTSFLQAEDEAMQLFVGGEVFAKERIEKTKTELEVIKKMLERIPSFLAMDGIKRYALIVGDSKKLLGSGGQVKALAIIEISGAEIISILLYEPSILDGKLKGVVEVPSDYAEHTRNSKLGIVDSLWYSDFSTSSKYLTRIIDDALDIEVDGVVSIDESIFLMLFDYQEVDITGIDIKSDGEIKLRDKLISVISVLTNPKNYNNNKLLFNLHASLKTKDILIHMKDPIVGQNLDDLNWSGKIDKPECGDKCLSDILEILEIPLSDGGDNLQNEVDLNISFDEGVIKKRLTVFTKNQNDFEYEAIFRVLAPDNSGFMPINIVTSDKKNAVSGFINTVDRFKENSVKTKILSNSTVGISFGWEQSSDKVINYDKYILKIIKQPGSFDHDLTVNINIPTHVKFEIPEGFFLTSRGIISYTTKLESDLDIEITFLK